jgi:serine/threonine protein kinase/tetratricopeptide (TPR) repeat protein
MGEVWSGVSLEDSTPVAIKVLTPEAARDPHSLEAFRTEVRSVARLRHPSIITVYDYGIVSPAAASASRNRLVSGSPYLVMELLPGHSVASLVGLLDWPMLRQLIEEILGALAHVHAHSVIHRDLKPSNILLTSPGLTPLPTPAVKLTDFGIAHVLEGGADSWSRDLAKGTPGYMAPEQAANHWRDFGPWTDLYSLGRVVLRLLGDENQSQRLAEQWPRAFVDWLGRLTAHEIPHRYQRAADALEHFRALEFRRAPTEEPTLDIEARPEDHTTTVDNLEDFEDSDDAPLPLGPDWEVPEQFPVEQWDADELPQGAGLGLYGLRPIPLVGRQSERQAMWNALRRVHAEQRTEVLCLRGASGFGKSRLAEWLCQAAHQTGAAQIAVAAHGQRPTPSDGLAPMLSRFFRCSELGRDELVQRLETKLRILDLNDARDWLSLTEIIRPLDEGEGSEDLPPVSLDGKAERHHVVTRVLAALALRRPAVVWIDDVQWGLESLELIHYAMSTELAEGSPILFLITIQEEALAQRPLEGSLLEGLEAMERCTTLHIGPLPAADHRNLVRRLLGLDDSLAARVEMVSDGNPLFAEQVVGSWVHRRFLKRGAEGFSLRPGAVVELPDSMHNLWLTRVEAIVEQTGTDTIALELAAVLGRFVDIGEWRSACRAANVLASETLVDALVDNRLVNTDPRRPRRYWEFVHGMLRESLERRAREGGRLAQHHRICAALIQGRMRDERVGLHLLAASEWDTAIDLLYRAADKRHRAGEFRRAHMLLAERERALDRIGAGDLDLRRIQGWLLRARCSRTGGELDDALTSAQRVADLSRQLDDKRTLGNALLVLESIARVRGRSAVAWRRAREAEIIARDIDDRELLGDAYKEQGWIRLSRGQVEKSRVLFKKSLVTLYKSALVQRASCMNGLAHAAIQAGELGEARQQLERALQIHKQLGSTTHEALTLGTLGDVERSSGRLDEAEAHYRVALELLDAGGYGHLEYAEMNLGLVLIERGHYEEARTIFEQALRKLERHQGCLRRPPPQGQCAARGRPHDRRGHRRTGPARRRNRHREWKY